MSIFDTFKISGSGLSAERLRMDLIADNLSNANTTRTPEGGPYRRKMVVFKTILQDKLKSRGVQVDKIVEDKSPFRWEYNPDHPDAIREGEKKGYVLFPNVNPVKEMVDMITASRAYEANVTALNSAKSMAYKALEIGK